MLSFIGIYVSAGASQLAPFDHPWLMVRLAAVLVTILPLGLCIAAGRVAGSAGHLLGQQPGGLAQLLLMGVLTSTAVSFAFPPLVEWLSPLVLPSRVLMGEVTGWMCCLALAPLLVVVGPFTLGHMRARRPTRRT